MEMIIGMALTLMANQLKNYLIVQDASWDSTFHVLLEDANKIATDNTGNYSNHIFLSLIRIEEERTLKNSGSYRATGLNGKTIYKNPELYLNLYLLVCANFVDYANALNNLSESLAFFQAKDSFTAANTPDPIFDGMEPEEKAGFQLNLELHSLSYEQTNYLWSTFGGKQLPHFVLKARLVTIRPRLIHYQGPLVSALQSQETIS
ncbi:DUF4255 domain-containing protein [Flavilitoribacter nigricans]|nr:DUF4255 domain-containing protein [Flavilitoribacter nigricans]